jgi:hypothetical protein
MASLTRNVVVSIPSTAAQRRSRLATPARASAAHQAPTPASPLAPAGSPAAVTSRRTAQLAALGGAALLAAPPRRAAAAEGVAPAACGPLAGTPSGLQFCEVQEGAGKEPTKGALIRCHYTGRLASNGKVFDSSYSRGRPLSFKVRAAAALDSARRPRPAPPWHEPGRARLMPAAAAAAPKPPRWGPARRSPRS